MKPPKTPPNQVCTCFNEMRRRKEASKVKQTTKRSNTAHPRQSLFLRKMSCLGWDSNPHVQLIFLGKVTAFGVLCCFALFVCLTLLASFFLPSHLSFKNMYIHALLWPQHGACTLQSIPEGQCVTALTFSILHSMHNCNNLFLASTHTVGHSL